MYSKTFLRVNKAKATAIAFITMLTLTTVLLACMPIANAEDVITTYGFVSAQPNPIGVGQTLSIDFWINEVPPSAGGSGGDRWQGLTVTVTKPDGTSQTLGPFNSDPVGSAYTTIVPNTVGTYYFQMNFPGQSFPNRTIQISPYMPPQFLPAATYKPCTSQKISVTVQTQQIGTYPNWPLPSGYWQRPINSENGNWYPLAGNWLMPQYDVLGNRFNPYSNAPNTDHIIWTKPIAFGGVVGGQYVDFSYYEGETYEPQLLPPVIMNGMLYYNTPNPPRVGFIAVDLRTGKTQWVANGSTSSLSISGFYVKRWGDITLGSLLDMELPNQHGIIPYLWGIDSSAIATIPVPVTYHLYDAFTGNLVLDMVNASAGTAALGPNGELLVYILNGGASWLAMWNSTKAIPTADVSGTGAWQWRPDNVKLLDWRNGIQWNVTVPAQKDPFPQTIAKVTPDVIVATTGTNYYKISSQIEIGYSATTGQQLWVQNRTFPTDTAFGLMGPVGEGVYTEYQKQTEQWFGYDLFSGNKLWGPTEAYTNAWGMYYAGQGGGSALIAYGKLYATAYDGMVHAYDIKTGKHLWDFSTGSSGFETVYGTYPLSSIGFSIADGKLYVCSGEHSPSMPLWRGGGMWCVDAQNGTALWKVTGWFEYPVIADGYLVALNGGDMQLYCFGKGQTATTISAPDVAVPKGTPVLIKGSVTDQSPGNTCHSCRGNPSSFRQ
jgi:PQQ-like domain